MYVEFGHSVKLFRLKVTACLICYFYGRARLTIVKYGNKILNDTGGSL